HRAAPSRLSCSHSVADRASGRPAAVLVCAQADVRPRGRKPRALTAIKKGARGAMKAKQALEVESSEVKANFDQIYTRDDPREYFRVLHGLDYIIPALARPVFRRICDTLTELRRRPINILDVGCSYGINAALLRSPVSMDRLAQRYADL